MSERPEIPDLPTFVEGAGLDYDLFVGIVKAGILLRRAGFEPTREESRTVHTAAAALVSSELRTLHEAGEHPPKLEDRDAAVARFTEYPWQICLFADNPDGDPEHGFGIHIHWDDGLAIEMIVERKLEGSWTASLN